MENYFVSLEVLDNLSNAIKSLSEQSVKIILYVAGVFFVSVAIISLVISVTLFARKKYHDAVVRGLIALGIAVVAGLGAGLFFVVGTYRGGSSGTNKTNTDNAVTNILNQ